MEFKKWMETFGDQAPDGVSWYDDDTDEAIPQPVCGKNLVARLALVGNSYWVRFEEADQDSYVISFGTRERGVFLTKGNSPFTVLNAVFGVIRTFLQACPSARFTFTAYSTGRAVVFEKMIDKLFPNYHLDDEGYYARAG